jgi:hypothetical protein
VKQSSDKIYRENSQKFEYFLHKNLQEKHKKNGNEMEPEIYLHIIHEAFESYRWRRFEFRPGEAVETVTNVIIFLETFQPSGKNESAAKRTKIKALLRRRNTHKSYR